MSDTEVTDSSAQPAGSEDALKECSRLDADLSALKVAYEQYFLGMERKPPKQLHDAVKTKVNNLKFAPFIRGASARFRIQGLHNKLLAYERMWSRTMYEMENGTYRRDLFKARLRAKRQSTRPGVGPEAPTVQDSLSSPGAMPATPATSVSKQTSPGAPPAQASGGAPALTDAKVKAIYDAYVAAKKKCNEDVSKISLDGLAQSLRKQIPGLMKQHKAKTVDFKIVIKDGKAILKAVPK